MNLLDACEESAGEFVLDEVPGGDLAPLAQHRVPVGEQPFSPRHEPKDVVEAADVVQLRVRDPRVLVPIRHPQLQQPTKNPLLGSTDAGSQNNRYRTTVTTAIAAVVPL